MNINCKIINSYNSELTIIGDGIIEYLGFDLRNPKPNTCTYATSSSFFNRIAEIDNVSCIFITKDIYNENLKNEIGKCLIICDNPKLNFFLFHNYLAINDYYNIAPFDTIIGENCILGKYAIISKTNVIIGNNVVIEDNVTIKNNVTIGDNTRIQSGAVIGNACIQCINIGNEVIDIEHVGGVEIGSDVKIESNSLVCKNIFNDVTRLDRYVRIGGLVHVTHGCKVGERSILTANIFLGGSTIIGKDVFIGPNVTTVPLVNIGDGAYLTIGSVVTKDVLPNKRVTGNFAISHDKFIQNQKKSIE